MSSIQPLYRWPPNIFYWKACSEDRQYACLVGSFLGSKADKYDLYQQVIRIEDGAYQILNLSEEYTVPLFSDPEGRQYAHIQVSHNWVYPAAKHTKTESTTSVDSIGVAKT